MQAPVRQYLKDYKAPNFLIEETHLTFEIHENHTLVTNQMKVIRKGEGPLFLHGPEKGLKSILIQTETGTDKECLEGRDYHLNAEGLTLLNPPSEFRLKILTDLKPAENTTLQGLYQSGTGLCTQCEPEGFRNITFFIDRPDVMARYKTTLIADKKKYPILLSNGNRLTHADLPNGRHQVEWQDPFPKPSYLFALVAGDYGVLKDQFITMSGRVIDLEIYAEHGNEYQCHHALEALKRSMKWDEEAYGREYDLNQYLILAVDDFNGGAMENKGLNIFNSRLVFADKTTATDRDFELVEAVIAHEYFHNWTGNRITLRDWFQLSLKEGLTVFREQHYMGDMTSPSLKRIDDVELLRNKQFPEDAGPNAHPVRPESCLAVDNFYTMTVYEKGAEVIRVLKQLLGEATFKKGMDLYFATHDGHSITIEDFLSCFEAVSSKNLSVFRRWYSQAGTPKVSVEEVYDKTNSSYTLRFTQSCGPTPDQENKLPFLIPIKLSLFSPSTRKPLSITPGGTEVVLELSDEHLEWTLNDCSEQPIPSILRGMTAPVTLDWKCTKDQLEFLASNDNDGFNQWESVQKLALMELKDIYSQIKFKQKPLINKSYVTLFKNILQTALEKPELTSRLLQLPSHEYFLQTLPLELDPEALSESFEILERELATVLSNEIWALEEEINQRDLANDSSFKSMGLRNLRKTLWRILGTRSENTAQLGVRFEKAKTMNEQAGLMEALNSTPSADRLRAHDLFEKQWSNNSLVINKWLTWNAQFNRPETLETVKRLSQGPHFKATNPNKVRALYGAFALNCWRGFHRQDGLGYEFFGEKIVEVDALNPSTAARLCGAFENWYRLEPGRKGKVAQTLETLLSNAKLSKNSFEILKRSFDFKAK